MTKIVLGYENLLDPMTGDGWNFNGRIEPTTMPHHINDPAFKNDYFNVQYQVLFNPSNRNFSNYDNSLQYIIGNCLFSHITPGEDTFVRMNVHDIKETKYIYPIEILNANFYFSNASHIAISDKVRQDVIDGLASIVIFYSHEGDLAVYFLSKLDALLEKLNLPAERIFVVDGNYDNSVFEHKAYRHIPVNVFPFWLQNFRRNYIVEYVPDKLYNCYNRRVRVHRMIIMTLLNRSNLYSKGITSLGYFNMNFMVDQVKHTTGFEITDEDKLFLASIEGSSPDNKNLDADSIYSDNPASDIVDEHYKRTFVSLVNETLTESIFFSEKIYKPILVGHPFLLMGGKNQLSKLREFGFKTFNRWWDESYDSLPTELERANAIVNILSELDRKSEDELIRMREEMKDTVIHNQKIIMEIIESYDWGNMTPVRNAILKILEDKI